MGISTDAFHDDALRDLDDSRDQNLQLNDKNSNGIGSDADEDDMRLLDFEVLDSEDDDEHDIFKHIEHRRAATLINRPNSPERIFKRANTDPVKVPKKRKKKKKKSVDLLSVLLPDNVDTSIVNDFSMIQESTQMTSMVSNENGQEEEHKPLSENDLTTVLEDLNNRATHMQKDLGERVFIDLSDYEEERRKESKSAVTVDGYKSEEATGQGPAVQKYDYVASNVRGHQNVTVDEQAGGGEQPQPEYQELRDNNIEEKEEAVENSEVQEPKVPDSIWKSSNNTKSIHPPEVSSKDCSLAQDHLGTENPVTAARPTKRKSTLAELCAKKSPVPYRVGLSRRANINHLHSYLSKK